MDRVSTCTLRIEKMLLERQKTMSDNMEIFLELDVDASSCGYYMIDHNARTEFWLDSLTTEELYLPPAVSKSHLRSSLYFQAGALPTDMASLYRTEAGRIVLDTSRNVPDALRRAPISRP